VIEVRQILLSTALLMASTPPSLLDRLKKASASSPDWATLQNMYLPLIKSWLTRIIGTRDAIEDLSQEVLVVLVRELPHFQSRGKGSFRAWLREVTVNQTRAHFKRRQRMPLARPIGGGEALIQQLEDPKSDLAREWDQAHDRHVSQMLLQLVKNDFEPTTWKAFLQFALDGRPAAAVAADLGISENAVLLAKSRVLKRLRQESHEFLA
jgi:RNA polymerase sigma factor (sigma-70 family)